MKSSRRFFLQQVATVACTSSFRFEGQTTPPMFPSSPRERLAVTSWPFRAYFTGAAPSMDIKEFPAMVVEKFDVHNINPLLNHFRSTDAAYLEFFRGAVARAKSHVVDFGLPGRCFATTDNSVGQAAVKDASAWIDIAAAIGSPSVRPHLSSQPGKEADLDAAVDHLSRLADYGGKRNVAINLENDGPTWEDPFFIVKVVEKANHPFLHSLPDFGNSSGRYGEEGNEKAVDAMMKHAFNMCHVKETVQLEGATHHVNLARMFAIARQNSYRGYFSMEFDSSGGDPTAGTSKLIEETLHYLA